MSFALEILGFKTCLDFLVLTLIELKSSTLTIIQGAIGHILSNYSERDGYSQQEVKNLNLVRTKGKK